MTEQKDQAALDREALERVGQIVKSWGSARDGQRKAQAEFYINNPDEEPEAGEDWGDDGLVDAISAMERVLTLAKKGAGVRYALGEEERKALTSLVEHGDSRGEFLSAEYSAAIEAALNLVGFTVEELKTFVLLLPKWPPNKNE